jgi:hypothetical protein
MRQSPDKTEIKFMAIHILAALIHVEGSNDDALVARSLVLASKLTAAVDALPDEEDVPSLSRMLKVVEELTGDELDKVHEIVQKEPKAAEPQLDQVFEESIDPKRIPKAEPA